MARFKESALVFIFFGILSANTYSKLNIGSKALNVLQNIVDTLLTSWMGNDLAALVLALLAIGVPFLAGRKSYEPNAQLVLNQTNAALKGGVYKASGAEIKAVGKPSFGRR